jgi:hypothetical protein
MFLGDLYLYQKHTCACYFVWVSDLVCHSTEYRKLGVTGNRVLMGIFYWRREGRDWRKLRNEELHNLCCSLNIVRVIISRRMSWAEHLARILEKINANRVLVGKPEGNRALGSPRGWMGGFCEASS